MKSRLERLTAGNASWLAMALVLFGVAALVTYEPSFEGGVDAVLTVAPWLMLAGLVVALLSDVLLLSRTSRLIAVGVALVGWGVVIMGDDRWSIMTFVVYALCYTVSPSRRSVGITLSALVSVVWAIAWLADGAPAWTAVMPLGVFVVAGLLTTVMFNAEVENQKQAALITQLRQTREDLAAAERSQGILEERARMAGEIHDTLAQGFTSIVLMSRAGQRLGTAAETLGSIEQTAQENLDAARRLIAALQPAELEAASLPDALRRHLSAAMPAAIATELRVVGDPRPLTGAVEVTLLRAAQEALLNVRTHAAASEVHVTLSYLDDEVVLDVRDDGIGFVPGKVDDRGSLTGGQGLQVLNERTRSLNGTLNLEASEGRGSVLSVLLPVGGS